MAKVVQMYRGTTAQTSTYTGPIGQIVVDTTRGAIRVQDGATPGGSTTLMADHNLSDLTDIAAAKVNLEFGTAADHDTSYFDLSGSAATAQTNAETFATAADVVVASAAAADATTKANAAQAAAIAAAATDATTKANAAQAAAISNAETFATAADAALPNGAHTTIYYSPSGSPSGGINGDLFLLGS